MGWCFFWQHVFYFLHPFDFNCSFLMKTMIKTLVHTGSKWNKNWESFHWWTWILTHYLSMGFCRARWGNWSWSISFSHKIVLSNFRSFISWDVVMEEKSHLRIINLQQSSTRLLNATFYLQRSQQGLPLRSTSSSTGKSNYSLPLILHCIGLVNMLIAHWGGWMDNTE